MRKFSVEYKVVERENFTIVTKQAKQVFDEFDPKTLHHLISEVMNSPGLEYLTIRRVKDKPDRGTSKS